MIRVLLFNTDLELGGTPTVIRELARRLPNEDFEVEVACLGRYSAIAKAIEADGSPVTAFDMRRRHVVRAVRRLRKLIAQRKIDVVLSFLVHANTVAAVARRKRNGVRWLQSIQTTQPTPRWHWIAQRLAAKGADGFVVPSQSIRTVACERSRIAPARVRVIPNAVDITDLLNVPQPPRDPATPLRVGFVGRLDPVKRVPLLVEAIKQMENVELHIFGNGPELRQITAAVDDSPKVTLHGFIDRHLAMASIDVLCLPSIAEGLPMVLIEAMAAGLPVIGARSPGITDVIADESLGYLFDGTVQSLVEVLTFVRDEPMIAHARAALALERVRRELTWDQVIPKYREFLSTTLPRLPRRPAASSSGDAATDTAPARR